RQRAALETLARLAPLPPAALYATAIDKGSLAAFMAQHGIPHPRTCLPAELATAALRYPLLIKPRRASGGAGVVKVETPAALQQELARRPDRADVCLQEYIEGADMGCSVLVHHGRIQAWTTQRGVSRRFTYASHSEIQMEDSLPVHAVVAQLMQALNWSGVANIDLRVDARTGQPLVLEINGRYWDSLWASTAARVNFPDLVCRLTLGEPLPAVAKRSGRFVQPRALPRDLLRLRPRLLRFRWNGLSMILSDPLPEAIAGFREWHSARAKG
ncbi:MAG: ATP-grasp domain-containing protein, partial [Verrucomicrobiota bacterium]